MREKERIKRILNLIDEIWTHVPDQRFMQLVSNLSWEYSNDNNGKHKEFAYSKLETDRGVAFTKDMIFVDCFHLEDVEFEKFLIVYLANLK